MNISTLIEDLAVVRLATKGATGNVLHGDAIVRLGNLGVGTWIILTYIITDDGLAWLRIGNNDILDTNDVRYTTVKPNTTACTILTLNTPNNISLVNLNGITKTYAGGSRLIAIKVKHLN